MPTKTSSKSIPPTPQPFEEQLARLEAIVDLLEDGTAPLADMLAHYAEGMKLAQSCRTYLEQAEQMVIEIDRASTRP